MLYKVFDLAVNSEIDLPDLEPVSGGLPTLTVERNRGAIHKPPSLTWHDVWGVESRVTWSYAWDGADLLVTVPNCGEFRVTDGFQRIVCHPYPARTEQTLSSQLCHSLIPRVLGELGHVVVHASCVRIDGMGGVLFVGRSGAGKSTLAASFAGDGGGDLLSDDMVLLRKTPRGLVAFVTGAYARLWDDSLANLMGSDHTALRVATSRRRMKWNQRFAAPASVPASEQVNAIFDMSLSQSSTDAPDVVISAESGAKGFFALTDSSMLLDPSATRDCRQRFDAASEVANACPAFYTISYPRRFDFLQNVRAAIVDRLERDGRASKRHVVAS